VGDLANFRRLSGGKLLREPKLAIRPAKKNIVGGRVHIPMRADEATGFTMDATADVVPFGASGRAR
jgi:hypothetical protein